MACCGNPRQAIVVFPCLSLWERWRRRQAVTERVCPPTVPGHRLASLGTLRWGDFCPGKSHQNPPRAFPPRYPPGYLSRVLEHPPPTLRFWALSLLLAPLPLMRLRVQPRCFFGKCVGSRCRLSAPTHHRPYSSGARAFHPGTWSGSGCSGTGYRLTSGPVWVPPAGKGC